MFFVYAIKSLTRNYIYVGLTENLERRYNEHNTGREKTTRPYKPFKLINTEEYSTRVAAREREKYFKTTVGKRELRKIATSELLDIPITENVNK